MEKRLIKQIAIPDLHEVTGLGRPIDLSLRSNQIAVIGSGLAGLFNLLFSWLGSGEPATLTSASVAAGVFLAWALAREISPDTVAVAYISMFLAGAVGLASPPAAVLVAVLLLGVRTLSGTVGSQLRTADLFVIVAGAGVAGTQPVAWPVVGLLAYAVLKSGHRFSRITALGLTVVGSSAAFLFVSEFAPSMPGVRTWLLLAGLGAAGWRRIRNPEVSSHADSGVPIPASGVGLARLATLTAIAAGAVLAPETGLTSLSPALAAFAAMALTPTRNPVAQVTRDQPITALEARVPVAV